MVAEASLNRGPGGGVQRDRVGPAAEPDAAGYRVDVAYGQGALFLIAGTVDEREQAGEGLVRVEAAVGGPAAEQALLECEEGGGAVIAAGLAS